ncbi:nickel transporter [Desulfosarcina ovata subsp. sediminis]|uniref:Nickel transporter n=1 Tax=Desulfosarcina ovata subsp. sediminis TaxID=885957 RepID=A0A5K7ZXS2_9BACT|nr:DUF4198 domain-containing protein [Desulfosarcina ovata]BBO85052.1 nickel transporter [Desulfosarcina ovata subsp. sediminis]
MREKCIRLSGALLVLSLLIVSPLPAHEFIVKPVTMTPHPGQQLPFSVISAHVFMVSEEMEPAEQVVMALNRDGKTTPLTLVKNPTLMTLDGSMELADEGTYLLCGHRKGVIWTNTTQGWKQASKKGLSNVISSGKYEKFCKTLINVGHPDDGYKETVGHALEIVPLDDPAALSPGDEGRFQVLFKGAPLSSAVYATYDEFSSHPNTWAYMTETDENGVAHIKLHHEGCWMIRVENKIKQATKDYDVHVMRAVLVFNIK